MSVSTEGGREADSLTPEDRQVSSAVTTGLSGERGELPTATASSSGTPGEDRNSQRLWHRGAAGQARASSRNCRRRTPKRIRLLPLQASRVPVPGPGARLQPRPDRFPPQPRPSPHLPPRAAFRPAGLPQEVNKRHVRSRPADGGRRVAATVEMLLPPSLYSRLAGAPGAAEPLPVERNPAAGAAPFRFTPRPVHFPRDHEFFEVRENLGRFSEPPTHRAGPKGRNCGCGRDWDGRGLSVWVGPVGRT